MTKKDYEKIAAAFKYVKPSNPLTPPRTHKIVLESMTKQWTYAVEAVASVLAADNPRFDRARFYRACGLETNNAKD